MSRVSLPGSVAAVLAVGTPNGQVPGISSLKGELENEPPTAMAVSAKKPRNAGRRSQRQSVGSASAGVSVGSGRTRWTIRSAASMTRRTCSDVASASTNARLRRVAGSVSARVSSMVVSDQQPTASGWFVTPL